MEIGAASANMVKIVSRNNEQAGLAGLVEIIEK